MFEKNVCPIITFHVPFQNKFTVYIPYPLDACKYVYFETLIFYHLIYHIIFYWFLDFFFKQTNKAEQHYKEASGSLLSFEIISYEKKNILKTPRIIALPFILWCRIYYFIGLWFFFSNKVKKQNNITKRHEII